MLYRTSNHISSVRDLGSGELSNKDKEGNHSFKPSINIDLLVATECTNHAL